MPEIPAPAGQGADPANTAPPSQSPVFILTASRSGSTLLRFILDSHKDLACPPETAIGQTCAQLALTWDILENADAGGARLVPGPAALDPEAIAAIREAADRVYGRYLRRRGKRRWCDKSLDNFQHAELISQVYPHARFICLYRHCMDVIASGIEACPWGVHRYGFDPFVVQNPGNSVAAIGSYWLATVREILAFEEKHPDSCLRVRYEDLVTTPEQTTAAILSFLGAAQAPGITRRCFEMPHDGNGPGDEKIWFSREVTAESLGRGIRVPAEGLHQSVRRNINEVLGRLGYRLVDDTWNAAVGQVDPRAQHAAPGGPAPNGHAARQNHELETIVRAIGDRISSRTDAERHDIDTRWPVLAEQTVSLVIQGADGGQDEIRLNFGPHRPDGQHDQPEDGEPVATLIAGSAVWRSLLNQEANLVTELTTGRLRCVNRRDGHRLRSDELHAVAALLGLARIPLVRR